MLRFIVLFMVAALVSGCASTAGTFFNRPVVEDSVDGAVSTISLSADRRTVVVVTEGPNRTKFCAEPPPDTATGLKSELDASLKAKAAKAQLEADLGLKDKFETTVVVVAERTAPLDAFRTGVYALCQLHLNGGMNAEDVKTSFFKLIDAFVS
jgi:hypothetical protein